MSALSDLVKHLREGDMIYKGAGYEHPYSRADEAAAEYAALQAENARLREALTEAVSLIKAWHNIDRRRILTEKEYDAMWQLYQQSPEMRRINAVLSGDAP